MTNDYLNKIYSFVKSTLDVGRCYYFGHGVPEDKKKAYDYIYQAVKDEYEPAIDFYNEFLK